MNKICPFVLICDLGSLTIYAGAGVQAGQPVTHYKRPDGPRSWHTSGTDLPHGWPAPVGREETRQGKLTWVGTGGAYGAGGAG